MGTVADFEMVLADGMVSAWANRERTRDLGPGDPRSQDAVTVVRRWGSILTGYCGDRARFGDTRHMLTHAGVRDLLRRQSRFTRCDADGTAPMYDDSVALWEFDMCHELIALVRGQARAIELQAVPRTIHRLGRESEITANVLAAYCGSGPFTLLEQARREELPWQEAGTHGAESVSALRDRVRGGRPVR